MATVQTGYSTQSAGRGLTEWADSMVAEFKRTWPKFSTELSAKQYAEAFEGIAKKYSALKAEAVLDLAKKRPWRDGFPQVGDLWELCSEANSPSAGQLFDPNCAVCDDGWETIGWEQFSPKIKNRLEKMYGHAIAVSTTKVHRCSVCWKGPQ